MRHIHRFLNQKYSSCLIKSSNLNFQLLLPFTSICFLHFSDGMPQNNQIKKKKNSTLSDVTKTLISLTAFVSTPTTMLRLQDYLFFYPLKNKASAKKHILSKWLETVLSCLSK